METMSPQQGTVGQRGSEPLTGDSKPLPDNKKVRAPPEGDGGPGLDPVWSRSLSWCGHRGSRCFIGVSTEPRSRRVDMNQQGFCLVEVSTLNTEIRGRLFIFCCDLGSACLLSPTVSVGFASFTVVYYPH